MRFFISVNKEEDEKEFKYYRDGLTADTDIPLGDLLNGGKADRNDSYKLALPCTLLMESLAAKRIKAAVHQSPVPKNLFFVESNSAHNMTYFTAGVAAASLAKDKKLLIVNFDQHADYSSAPKEFWCGNWGGFAKKDLQCDYLVIGEASSYSHKKCQLYSGGKLSKKDLGEIADIFKVYDVFYVTVDMDVLKNGVGMPKRTNWKEGMLLKEQLKSYLDMLPDGKIISADITGFPPYEISKLEENEEYFKQYIADINEIAEKLESKF